MHSFKEKDSDYCLPLGAVWLMNSISEYKGKQELYTRQSPQILNALVKTALIEKNAFVGGNMQIGLNIHGFEDMNGQRVIGGNSWELIQRCIRAGGAVGPVP